MCHLMRYSKRFQCVSVSSTYVPLAKPMKEKLCEIHKNVVLPHSLDDHLPGDNGIRRRRFRTCFGDRTGTDGGHLILTSL